jgi:Arc/MetJ family transcription regulator
MMRTTLNLDERALKEAMAVADGSTKTEVVNQALRSFARGRRRKRLLELRGKVAWEGDVDRLRRRR